MKGSISKIKITLSQMVEALVKICNPDSGKGPTDDSRPEYKKSVRTDMPRFDGTCNVHGWVRLQKQKNTLDIIT